MKKKILSFALSGLLALSAVFGLAACKPQENGELNGGGSNGNTNNGTSGGTVKPGTVITDETIKSAVFSALAEAEIKGLTYSGSVNLSMAQGAETTAQKVLLEGAALLDKSVQADVCLTLDGDEGLLYLLGFLRDDGAYVAMGEAEGETVDFSALKAQLKAEKDPILLEKSETGVAQELLAAPVTVKLVKNLTSLVDGVVTKTEGGYSLAFDLIGGVGELLKGAETVAEAIDKTADMTLTGLFSQKFVDDTLSSLLHGITAEELSDLIDLLPEEVQTLLPEPAAKQSAKEYLLGLLRSGNFYTAVTGEEAPWSDYQTFGEVPLATLLSLLTDGEAEPGALKLKEALSALEKELPDRIVTLLLDALSFEGKSANGKVDFGVTFSFDDDKKLLGMTIDALAEGDVVPDTGTQPQPDGGSAPEDGNGDTMETAAENAAKVHLGLKLNATCAQAPELYDLKGCKYQGSDGPVTIK